ncbi:MAG: SUMF1/EgtB/PvdO family nonheme iron enzyme, partial [Candidatus Delongbacteria bacterium]|nr:SUMF1/EgtB/PvdO family nonheme iron enzyme [Candidatus Delongbacteria bacterium]
EFKDFTSSSGFQMVAVEGGSFKMGSQDDLENQKPVHTVKIDSFYIAKYEVTQRKWTEFMGYEPVKEHFGKHWLAYDEECDPELPVCYVSFLEVAEFCNLISNREGLDSCYLIVKDRKDPFNKSTLNNYIVRCKWNNNGYRMPTEAEWEYAARGGNKSKGFIYSGSNDEKEVAWGNYYYPDSNNRMNPPGKLKPNELGIFDMSGNTNEWCWDWYDENYYRESPEDNPKGPKTGSKGHVYRGGYFHDGKDWMRVTRRNAEISSGSIGIRLVRNK